MTDAEKEAAVVGLFSAAGKLMAAGLVNHELRTCLPAEVRRLVSEAVRRGLRGMDYRDECMTAVKLLAWHCLNAAQLHDRETRHDAVALRAARQWAAAMRLAAEGEEEAVAFLRDKLADAGNMAFIKATELQE